MLLTGRSLASPHQRRTALEGAEEDVGTERPMAVTISMVRNVPDEPTSVPATRSNTSEST